MKKLILIVVIIITSNMGFSQEGYLKFGKNYTQYVYKSGNSNPLKLKIGDGNFYEIGYGIPIKNKDLKYSIGIQLNRYNATSSSNSNSYSWNTDYIGIFNSLNYKFLKINSKVSASINGGLGMNTIIYGIQSINGEYFSLKKQKEFSGIFIEPHIGIQANYSIYSGIYLSLGYKVSKNLSITNNSDEKLSFVNNQIQFGLTFLKN